MPALSDLTGRIFERLAVIGRAGTTTNGKALWACRCSCGGECNVSGTDLRSGHSRSCGCLRDERNRKSSLAHGLHGTATYRTWEAMKTRCTNPRSKSYPDYGAKGITVCARWATSFEAFLADMGERPDGTTIDRFPDQSGNHEPSNCRWATKQEQQRNTMANVLVEFKGETLTQAEWAQRQGIRQATLSYRLRRGWPVLQALSLAPRYGNRVVASKLGDEVDLP